MCAYGGGGVIATDLIYARKTSLFAAARGLYLILALIWDEETERLATWVTNYGVYLRATRRCGELILTHRGTSVITLPDGVGDAIGGSGGLDVSVGIIGAAVGAVGRYGRRSQMVEISPQGYRIAVIGRAITNFLLLALKEPWRMR